MSCPTCIVPLLYNLSKKFYFCLLNFSNFFSFFIFVYRSSVFDSRGRGRPAKPILKDPRPLSDKQFQNAAVQKVRYASSVVCHSADTKLYLYALFIGASQCTTSVVAGLMCHLVCLYSNDLKMQIEYSHQ